MLPLVDNHVSSHLLKTPINKDSYQSGRRTLTHIQKSWSSAEIKLQSLRELQPSNLQNIQREIIQVIFLNLKVHWNQVQKCLETSRDCKLVKIYGFKPPKSRRTSTTIFIDEENIKNIQWTYKEREEHTKNTKYTRRMRSTKDS